MSTFGAVVDEVFALRDATLAAHGRAVDLLPPDELRERLITLAANAHDLRYGRNGSGTPGVDCSDHCPACIAMGGRTAVEAELA